jgi:hypothetical protein
MRQLHLISIKKFYDDLYPGSNGWKTRKFACYICPERADFFLARTHDGKCISGYNRNAFCSEECYNMYLIRYCL